VLLASASLIQGSWLPLGDELVWRHRIGPGLEGKTLSSRGHAAITGQLADLPSSSF
jgi:hypothetical protein